MNLPAIPTIDELEFHKLAWPQFERLCRDLVASLFANLQNIREHLSQGHKQDGIDIRGFDPNYGRYLYIQCKKEKSFTAKDIENAISLFESGEFFEDSKTFILCVISKVSKNHEDVIKKTEKKFQNIGKEFIIWDGVALTNILREQPQIVYDLFGSNYALNFCGAERYKKIIIRPEVKSYPAPENYVPRLLLFLDRVRESYLRISLIDSLEGIGNHILIKGEATIGKTTELKFIAHHYSVIIKDLYFPVLVSLKNYVLQSIEELLVDYFSDDWRKIAKSQLLIILDGFDEVKTEERENFLRRLDAFTESNPTVNIIISTRTNFVNDGSTFSNYKTYYLSEFDDADIRNYVEKLVKPNRVGEFYIYINEQHIKHWISSPYNLSNFIEIYNSSSLNLPKTRIELIEAIIQLRLKADLKYRFNEFQQIDCHKILEKLAFSFTLYGVNSVSNADLAGVFSIDEIEILKKMSVLNFEDNCVKFSHNVLQEFLTAKLLSAKTADEIFDFITFHPRQKIKPKWYNTIGILIEMLPLDSKLLKTLLLFISDKEPSILNQIEFRFIPFDLRLEVFKVIISDPDRLYKPRGIYMNNLSRFGGIDENEAVLEFLIEFIASQKQENIRQEALYCLSMKAKETLWGYDKEIIDLLYEVINETEDLQIKYLCINVLNVFQLFDTEFANTLKEILIETDDFRLIDEIIEYFNLSDSYDDYIDIYFECLVKYEKYSDDTNAVRGYGINLQNGLKGIKSPENVNRMLDYFIKNVETVYKRESIFTHKFYNEATFFHSFTNHLCEVYVVEKKIKNKALNFLEKSNFSGNDEFADYMSQFFFKTNTNKWAFWRLWNNRKDKNRSYKLSLGFLADENLLHECTNKFVEGEITPSEIWGLIHYLNIAKRNELAEQFRSEMNELSNNYFTYPEQKDFTALYELRKKKDLELLINKPQFVEKTIQFFDYYRKKELSIDEVLSYKKHWEDVDNEITGSFLLEWFRNREDKDHYKIKKSVVENWFKSPKNWKDYVIRELFNRRSQEILVVLVNYIQNWCEEVQDKTNFKTAITDNDDGTWSTRWNEIYYSEFFLFFDLKIPKSKLLEMLSFDIYGSDRHSVEKAKETISDKVIRLIGGADVENILLENLKEGNLSFRVLENHVGWAKKLNLLSASPFIKNLILSNPNRSDYGLNRCLDIYMGFGGNLREFTFIFDFFATENQFHWYLLDNMANQGVFKRKIESLLQQRIKPKLIDENLFQSSLILVEIGSITGLEWFVKWYKSRQILNDRDKFIKNLDKISLEEALPYLKELVVYVLNKKISKWSFLNPIGKIFKLLEQKAISNENDFEKIVSFYNEMLLSKFPNDNVYHIKNSFFVFESEYYLQKVDFFNFSDVKKWV